MSPRIKNAFILLLFFTGAAVLFRFIIFGWGNDFLYKWEYFFDLDTKKWYVVYPLGILTLGLLGSICYGYYLLFNKALEKWIDKRDPEIAFIRNDINRNVPLIWIAACVWFFNGNFISYNYIGLELEGESTEYGTPTGHYHIVKAEETYAIAHYENMAYSDEDNYVDDVNKHRFKFLQAGVFEGYKYDNKSFKGFGGFLICMISYFIENLVYIFTMFTIPMLIFIIFREIDYKK